jgi:nifR3 family TIM-barrel protein
LSEAARELAGEGAVDHIDLNFGCPVRKVTSHGGGAAIPVKPRLMAKLVRAVVGSAGPVPVTVKVRKGIDEERLSFLSSGKVAQEEGCAAIGLHARTAAQLYDGEADWGAITELKASVSIPVLGNGDVWEAFDALRMMRETRCDGVIVGRGCLGRPWLFRELEEAFSGVEPSEPPRLAEVAKIAERHAELLVSFAGEKTALLQMRKLGAWYTKAFPGAAAKRAELQRVSTLEELRSVLARLDGDEPFPEAGLRARRGKHAGRQKVHLPHGYLDDLEDDTPPCAGAEIGAETAEGG